MLYSADKGVYTKLCAVVKDATDYQLPSDPGNAQGGGHALCSGKTCGFRGMKDLMAHVQKKSEAASQRSSKQRSSIAYMFGDGSDEDEDEDEDDGDEAAEAWVHAELAKHLERKQELQPVAKRPRLNPIEGGMVITKPFMLRLQGLPTNGSTNRLDSQAAWFQKFGFKDAVTGMTSCDIRAPSHSHARS